MTVREPEWQKFEETRKHPYVIYTIIGVAYASLGLSLVMQGISPGYVLLIGGMYGALRAYKLKERSGKWMLT